MDDLDSVDRKILYELDRNSRQTYLELGRKVRAKKDTVKYRIEKMMERGFIKGFYTVIDYSKFGFMSFRLYVELTDIPLTKLREFINYLNNHKNVTIFYRTSGRWDFTFSVWMRDIWEYEVFWNEFTGKFGKYFLNSHLALKTKYTEFSRDYLYPKGEPKKQFTVLQKTEKVELDNIDFRILNILSTNARASLVELSKKINTSVVTCRSHLKNLIKKKVIVGFRTILDYRLLKHTHYKVDLWLYDTKNIKQIKQQILSHPNVIYDQSTLITSDLEFDIEVIGFQEFIAIMDSFRKSFPNEIKRYEYYTLVENYKFSYLPSL